MDMTPRRVVVVGATGNVGSALMRTLAADPGVRTLVGVARRLPRPELRAELPDVEWHAADITRDPLDVVADADVVVHLAWLIQPSHDEALMRATNIDGTRRLVDAVVRHRVPALVYASSVGTYAPGPKTPVGEGHPATGIASSVYSRHKAAVERMLDETEREHEWLRVVRMRTSLVVQRSAASEIHRLFLGALPWHLPRPLRLIPDIDRICFQVTHADDVATAYAAAITGDATGPFNIAADPVLTAATVAEAVGGRTLPLPLGPLRAAIDVAYRLHLQPSEPGWLDMLIQTPLLDSTRARRELGWLPAHRSVDALREVLDGIGAGAGAPTEPLRPRTDRAGADGAGGDGTGADGAGLAGDQASPATARRIRSSCTSGSVISTAG